MNANDKRSVEFVALSIGDTRSVKKGRISFAENRTEKCECLERENNM